MRQREEGRERREGRQGEQRGQDTATEAPTQQRSTSRGQQRITLEAQSTTITGCGHTQSLNHVTTTPVAGNHTKYGSPSHDGGKAIPRTSGGTVPHLDNQLHEEDLVV